MWTKPEELSRIKKDEYFRGSKDATDRISSVFTQERKERKEFIEKLRNKFLENPCKEIADLLIAIDR